VIYKVITKDIANRIKPIMSKINSQEQGGYIEGRKILDGIIVFHEVIHSPKTIKSLGMLIKIDMSKAYDRLN
jgi:hypothetical protein